MDLKKKNAEIFRNVNIHNTLRTSTEVSCVITVRLLVQKSQFVGLSLLHTSTCPLKKKIIFLTEHNNSKTGTYIPVE